MKIGAVIVASAEVEGTYCYPLFQEVVDELLSFNRGETRESNADIWWTVGYVPGDTYEQQLEAAIRELTQSLERYREERAIDEKCAHWSTPPSRLMPVGHNLYRPDCTPNPICPARKLMAEGFVDGYLVYDVKSPTKWSVSVDGSLLHINPDSTVEYKPDGLWKSLCE